MPYQPIEHYGVIGDLHSVAMVGLDGSIDWCCLPAFDSPSVFGALLDDEKGGRFRIAPAGRGFLNRQMYLPDTNILVTRFLGPDGIGEVVDLMPVEQDPGATRHEIVRRVSAVRGAVRFRLHCAPAFDYARARHELRLDGGCATFLGPTLALTLTGPAPLRAVTGPAGLGPAVEAEFVVEANRTVSFVLESTDRGATPSPASPEDLEAHFRLTTDFWRRWIERSTYRGRWREAVNRSLLVLKLMTYQPTGAIVAAPTTSLPEVPDGVRNWDYRYTWIRDAAFTVYALVRCGFHSEAAAFMAWVAARCADLEEGEPLQIVYGIDGRSRLTEEELPHLEGYRGSRPVRVGNAAAAQLQLDIYGELLDAAYLYDKYGAPIPYHVWALLRRHLGWLADNWTRPDRGLWEVRTGPRHFVFSKVMSWVAFDRAVRMGRKRGLPADYLAWERLRDAVYEEVMTKGWNEARGAFVQTYGSAALDASLLILPLVRFVGPTDPRMLATLDRICDELVSDSLVYRYDLERGAVPDVGELERPGGHEGTFSLCSFWLVECLARAGRLDQARLAFEKMLTYASPLGLFAEQIGPQGGQRGNYPQALTHLSLVSAAYALDRALDAGNRL
jgi:GH15 family glucan-1,4-alpha-glucosidase